MLEAVKMNDPVVFEFFIHDYDNRLLPVIEYRGGWSMLPWQGLMVCGGVASLFSKVRQCANTRMRMINEPSNNTSSSAPIRISSAVRNSNLVPDSFSIVSGSPNSTIASIPVMAPIIFDHLVGRNCWTMSFKFIL